MSSERQISGSTVLSVSERLIETSQGKLRLQLDEGMVYDLLNKLGLREVTIDISSRPLLTEKSSKGFLVSFGENGNEIWFISLGETTAGYEKYPFMDGLALSLNHGFLHEIYELKQEHAHQRWNGPPLKKRAYKKQERRAEAFAVAKIREKLASEGEKARLWLTLCPV